MKFIAQCSHELVCALCSTAFPLMWFYVQHVHKSFPVSLLKSVVFDSIGNKVLLTHVTQRFLAGQTFFKAPWPVVVTFVQ